MELAETCKRPKPPQNKGLGVILHPEYAFCKQLWFWTSWSTPIPGCRKVAIAGRGGDPRHPQTGRRTWPRPCTPRRASALPPPRSTCTSGSSSIDVSDARDDLRVFINPEIVAAEGEAECEEGCLSVPGYYDKVMRAAKITVRAQNERGESFELSTDGMLAVCIQHEMDHLIGKVFVDYLSPLKRARLATRLKKKQRSRASRSGAAEAAHRLCRHAAVRRDGAGRDSRRAATTSPWC